MSIPLQNNKRVYYRANMPPQAISYYCQLFFCDPLEYTYVVKPNDIAAFRGTDFWWVRDTEPLRYSIATKMEKWMRDKDARDNFFEEFTAPQRAVSEILTPRKEQGTTGLTNDELWENYRVAHDYAFEYIAKAEYTVDSFDDHFPDLFQEFVVSHAGEDVKQDMPLLLTPSTLSAGAQYRLALLDACESKQSNLDHIVQQYSWIQMTWLGEHERTQELVGTEVEELQQKPRDERTKERQRIVHYTSMVEAQRNALLKKYHLPQDETHHYWMLLDQFNHFHDYRKEIQMRANQVIFPILHEAAQRFRISFKDINWYVKDELHALLVNGATLSAPRMAERQEGLVWEIHQAQVKETVGKAASHIIDSQITPLLHGEQTTELKGMPACVGAASGTAFVTQDARTANKEMREGQVLITNMTTVDFLPAMKRAAAIVTDDGGATCHAAVVSRELNKPCIVGTKHASTLFHSGEQVTVDATHGIVRRA